MKKKDYFYIIIFVIVISIGFYRYRTKKFTAKKSKIKLDTIVEISVTSKHKNVVDIVDSAYVLIDNYEKNFNYYDSTSILSQINRGELKTLNRDFEEIFGISRKIYEDSDSLFDITIAPLIDLWDFENEIIPSDSEIEAAKMKVGLNKIILRDNQIDLNGTKIILGALAKGYIVDKVVEFLKLEGASSGYVNAGGDIKFFGYKGTIPIGIRHPRDKKKLIAELDIQNAAIVTSGDYERYFVKDGRRYHHIINPKTGMPVPNTISVTIITEKAVLADALSTAVFLMNKDEAVELIKSYENTEAIIYYKENSEIISLKTQGIKELLKREYF